MRTSSYTVGTIAIENHILAIREYATDDFGEIYAMLGTLPRRFSAKLLRQFKDSVFRLAYDSTPSSNIHVLPFDETADTDKVEMVIGVGTMARLAALGYGHYRRSDLIRDMLTAQTEHDPDRLINRLLFEQFATAPYNPLYYPLIVAGRLHIDGSVDEVSDLPERAQDLLRDPDRISAAVGGVGAAVRSKTFRQLLAEGGNRARNYGPICQYEVDDVVALRDYLGAAISDSTFVETALAKLACKYDQLVFGFGFHGDRRELLEALGLDVGMAGPR